jgi:Glycosyl hydrolase catalytic core
MPHCILARARSLLTPCFVAALASCGTSTTEVLHTSTGSGGGSASSTSSNSSSGASTSSSSTGIADGGSDGGATECKRGIAYGQNSVADLTALSKGISWWYNWGTAPDSAAVAAAHDALGVEYVPMAWGQATLPDLASQVPTDTKYLLGFNEPNFDSQADLTPAQAAALWPQVEAFATQRNLKIVSPAVNYCGSTSTCTETNPFTWLTDFFAACPGCQVDYIAMHWYACTASALTVYLQQFESMWTQPLWLTEFSCLDATDVSVPVQEAYMQAVLPLLEADPRVFRYSWFTGRSTGSPTVALLGADGALTPLGQIYVTAPEACKP